MLRPTEGSGPRGETAANDTVTTTVPLTMIAHRPKASSLTYAEKMQRLPGLLDRNQGIGVIARQLDLHVDVVRTHWDVWRQEQQQRAAQDLQAQQDEEAEKAEQRAAKLQARREELGALNPSMAARFSDVEYYRGAVERYRTAIDNDLNPIFIDWKKTVPEEVLLHLRAIEVPWDVIAYVFGTTKSAVEQQYK